MLSNEPMCLEPRYRANPSPVIRLFQCSLTSRCVWNFFLSFHAVCPSYVSMLSNEPMCLELTMKKATPIVKVFQCSLTSRCVWNKYTHIKALAPVDQFQCSLTSRCVWNDNWRSGRGCRTAVSMLSNEPMCLERRGFSSTQRRLSFQCSLTSRCVWNAQNSLSGARRLDVSMLSNEPMCLELIEAESWRAVLRSFNAL